VGETQPQNGHRPIKLWKRHINHQSDDHPCNEIAGSSRIFSFRSIISGMRSEMQV
jgi:hypothetical protein